MPVLLQFDFPHPGPWGEEMAQAPDGLARSIPGEPGFLWKIWTENADEGRAGGIYLFEDEPSARAYMEMHRARLESFGYADVRGVLFHVNGPLTALNRGPLTPA